MMNVEGHLHQETGNFYNTKIKIVPFIINFSGNCAIRNGYSQIKTKQNKKNKTKQKKKKKKKKKNGASVSEELALFN